jgi:hypothetical protein
VREATVAQLRLPARLRTGTPTGSLGWQRVIVPSQSGWPRWFLAVGTAPAHSTPVLSVLYSPSARAPYGLWAQLALLPGEQLPGVAPADRGAPVLRPDAGGLLLTPQDTAGGYADVLTRGAASPFATKYAPDTFRQQVTGQLGHDRALFLRLGTVAARHTVQPARTLALGTADSGAIVISVLTQTYLVTVQPGAGTVKVDPALAALAGRDRFARRVTRTSQEVVAFVVPAAGSTDKIHIVAAAKTDLAATGS